MSEPVTRAAPAEAAKPFGIVGVFDTPAQLYHACEKLRDAGYKHFDAHTPFPVHGLEQAMGLRPSKMPWISLTGGALGLASMIALAWYVAKDYPMNISGKEAFSWQAYVPIFFEVTVLFSALFTFVGVWAVNKLPAFFHPVMTHPRFAASTDDKFLISIEARDPKFDEREIRTLLEELGAHDVAEVLP